MNRYLFLLLLLLGITAKVSAQEMMLNGSFENYDGNPDGDSDPSTVSYAAFWRNLTGTCDLVHPSMSTSMSGTPCFGVGCGRFGVSPSGWAEYMYGQTLQLTAGQTYEVSFWIRKDYPTDVLRKVGLAITENVPTSAITNTVPLISHLATTTQCVKLKACFTAQTNTTHYVTIGPFGGQGTTESLVYMVDSVSVLTIPAGTPYAESNVTSSKPVYCMGDQIQLDGTESANETSYEWNIYYSQTLVYTSGVLSGTAGVLNNPPLPFMEPGACYRAELTVYGVCKDVSTVEFCIANPNIDFIFDGNPVCENFPVDLQVTGENGWTYAWSDGNGQLVSGTGASFQMLTVTPTIGNATYTVTVTTPEGCTHTETLTLNVNSPNNIAPWMDGINGTGEYVYYVSQGDAVFFNSLLSNDHLNENILITTSTTLPTGYAVSAPTGAGTVLSLSWVTSLATPVGEYHYYLIADDKNACNAGIDTFDFRIIVVCDQCPVCLSYENRTPSGISLPPETKAGKCIEAGLSQPVSTGDANVLFQAGVSITEGPYFEAGPGYEAVIDPTTCVTDCEDCCTDWVGFHFDEHPYYSYMNHSNNDPTDDYFEITDLAHPFCAYGAMHFEMHFIDSDNGQTYHSVYGGGPACCALRSKAPENPIPHSSIFWNGMVEAETGGWTSAPNQVYFVQLILHGCNGASEEHTFYLSKNFYGGIIQNNSDTVGQMVTILNPEKLSERTNSNSNSTQVVPEELEIYPNPATNMLYISGSKAETITIQLYDEKGHVLTKREIVIPTQGYSLDKFSAGKYYCRIYKEDGSYVLKEFIKL
jgi:hypothetical protein